MTSSLVVATGYPSKSSTNTTVSLPSSVAVAVLPSGSGYPVKAVNTSAGFVPYPSGTGASASAIYSGTGKLSSSIVAPTSTPVVSATGGASAASSSAVEFTGAAGRAQSVGSWVVIAAAGVLGLMVL